MELLGDGRWPGLSCITQANRSRLEQPILIGRSGATFTRSITWPDLPDLPIPGSSCRLRPVEQRLPATFTCRPAWRAIPPQDFFRRYRFLRLCAVPDRLTRTLPC